VVQECLSSNRLHTAASYLIILQNLENHSMAQKVSDVQHWVILCACISGTVLSAVMFPDSFVDSGAI